jgi:hypothetical protein
VTEVLNAAMPFLQSFSYLLGHCRGLQQSFGDHVPSNWSLLVEKADLQSVLLRMESELDALWDQMDKWESFDVFQRLLEELCTFIGKTTGVFLFASPNRGLGFKYRPS